MCRHGRVPKLSEPAEFLGAALDVDEGAGEEGLEEGDGFYRVGVPRRVSGGRLG